MFGNDQFTVVLLHMDGSNGGTSFPDVNAGGSAHTWTPNSATTSTAQFKFGTASCSVGSTGWIDTPDSTNFTLGSGNFTIDAWVYRSGGDGTSRYFCGQCDASGSASSITAGIHLSTGNVFEGTVASGAVLTQVTGTTTFTTTGWNHVALVRTGNILKLFVNGIQEGGNVAFNSTVNDNANNYAVGRLGALPSQQWNGFIDEFRLSLGVARWTANFTPPNEPYDVPTNPDLWRASDISFRQATRAFSPAAIMPKDDGIQAPYIPPAPNGWPIQDVQPSSRMTFPNQRAGAVMRGDDGTQDVPFFALNRFDFGPAMFYRRRYRMPEFGGPGVGGDEPPFPGPNWNWEPHVGPVARRVPRPGFLAATSLVEVLPPPPDAAAWALDTTELIYRRRPVAAVENEPSFLPLPRAIPWGYDHPEAPILRRRRLTLTQMREGLVVPRRDIWGFEPQFPVLRRRPVQVLDRNELIVVPRRAVWGWEVAAPGPFPTLRRRRVLDRGYELVTSFPPTLNSGWAVQPWQPPRFGRNRAAGLMRGDDGAYVPVTKFYPSGWAPVLFWPPHPRPERAGAIMAGDLSGAWGPFVYLVPSGATARHFSVYLATAYQIGQPPS